MASFNLTTSYGVSDRYGAAYRTMPLTTTAIISWGTDAGPKVLLHQPRKTSQRSTCFSFMDAIPFGSGLRPRCGTVLLAIRQTHGVTALSWSGCTMMEAMRVVVAYPHLPTLRDMPMSAKYRAIAAAYSGNYGKECAMSKKSTPYACTRGGTAWRALPWALRARLRRRISKRRR